jgi:hypothetical protein
VENKLAKSDTAFLLQKTDTFTLSNRINLKLSLSDTANMLSNRIARDTASLSRRINNLVTGTGDLATLKLNITDTVALLAKRDTAAMLSSRFERDTANLSRRIDLLDQSTFVNNALKIDSDTAYKYLLKKVDTITLSDRIDAIALSSNVFTTDITLNMGSGKTFGKYSNGQTIPSKGKSLDEVMRDIVTLAIPPTYTSPLAGLSMGTTSEYEIGTNLGTLTYSPNFTQNDGGNFTAPWLRNNTNYTSGNSIPTPTPSLNYSSQSSTLTDTNFYYAASGYSPATGSYPSGIQSSRFHPLTMIGARSGSGPIGFQKAGNIGADGSGLLVTGSIYSGSVVDGFTAYAFYRQSYAAGDPTICDVYVLLGHPNWGSIFDTVISSSIAGTSLQGAALYATGSSSELLAMTTLLSNVSASIISSGSVKTVVDNYITLVKTVLNY